MENQNKTNEEQASLISRLLARFFSPKIAKRIATLVLAGTMMLAPVGCSDNNIENNGNDTSNDTYQTGDLGQNNNTDTNNSQTEESEYSQMLLNVLNDPHYNSLIDQSKRNPDIFQRGEFNAIPYAFYEDEGFDVDAMIRGELPCSSTTFVKASEPNNLYIATRAKRNVGDAFSTQYILKYKLSDKEMRDFNAMHEGFYIQAYFLNNEISELHTPEVISEVKITTDAQSKLYESLRKYEKVRGYLNGATVGTLALKSYDVEKGTFEVLATTPLSAHPTMKIQASMNVIRLEKNAMLVEESADGAFMRPCEYAHYRFSEEQNQAEKIALYQHLTTLNTDQLKNYEVE